MRDFKSSFSKTDRARDKINQTAKGFNNTMNKQAYADSVPKQLKNAHLFQSHIEL